MKNTIVFYPGEYIITETICIKSVRVVGRRNNIVVSALSAFYRKIKNAFVLDVLK